MKATTERRRETKRGAKQIQIRQLTKAELRKLSSGPRPSDWHCCACTTGVNQCTSCLSD
jgi:hypothetical protein